MKLQKKLILPLALIAVLSVYLVGTRAGSAEWTAVQNVIAGIKASTLAVNTVISVTQSLAAVPTVNGEKKLKITGLTGSYTQVFFHLSDDSGAYTKKLYVWTRATDVSAWSKAMEFLFTSTTSGEIIFRPNNFDNGVPADAMQKYEYSHNDTTRTMAVNIDNPTPIANISKSKALVSQEGGYTTVYFTAQLSVDATGAAVSGNNTGVNDVYLMGLTMLSVSPYYCTVKQGVQDSGEALGFTFYDAAHPNNPGYFENKSLQAEGVSPGGSYPDEADITAAGLPAEADLASISFITTAVPDETGATEMSM